MSTEFTHCRIMVRDFAACFRFYQEVLGWSPLKGEAVSPYAEFQAGRTNVALFDERLMREVLGAAAAPVSNDGDRFLLSLEVSNVDRECASLRERGAIIAVEPTDRPLWSLRTAHLRDPEGNLLELYESLAAK